MRWVALVLVLFGCGAPPDGSLGALCRCNAAEPTCTVQVTSCAAGLRCSNLPPEGGVCVVDR